MGTPVRAVGVSAVDTEGLDLAMWWGRKWGRLG